MRFACSGGCQCEAALFNGVASLHTPTSSAVPASADAPVALGCQRLCGRLWTERPHWPARWLCGSATLLIRIAGLTPLARSVCELQHGDGNSRSGRLGRTPSERLRALLIGRADRRALEVISKPSVR